MSHPDATPEAPVYRALAYDDGATRRWMVICDEGWRTSIVCSDMYDWAADWLAETLGRQPFAPGRRS